MPVEFHEAQDVVDGTDATMEREYQNRLVVSFSVKEDEGTYYISMHVAESHEAWHVIDCR